MVLVVEQIGGSVRLSATDLVGHLNCDHLTGLDLAVAKGNLEKPKAWDPLLEILWERGARHEKGAGLELGDLQLIGETERSLVAGYNKDDCLSTAVLRDWLDAQRAILIAQVTPVERPDEQEGEAGETVSAWQEKIDPLIAQLTADVPADVQERTPEQQGGTFPPRQSGCGRPV